MARTKGSRNGYTKYPGKYVPVGVPAGVSYRDRARGNAKVSAAMGAKNQWQQKANRIAGEESAINRTLANESKNALLTTTGFNKYMKRVVRDPAGRAAGEGYATNRALSGLGAARIVNQYEKNRYYSTVDARKKAYRKSLHDRTQKAAAASRVRNSRSDIGNALHDAKEDFKSMIAKAVRHFKRKKV